MALFVGLKVESGVLGRSGRAETNWKCMISAVCNANALCIAFWCSVLFAGEASAWLLRVICFHIRIIRKWRQWNRHRFSLIPITLASIWYTFTKRCSRICSKLVEMLLQLRGPRIYSYMILRHSESRCRYSSHFWIGIYSIWCASKDYWVSWELKIKNQ